MLHANVIFFFIGCLIECLFNYFVTIHSSPGTLSKDESLLKHRVILERLNKFVSHKKKIAHTFSFASLGFTSVILQNAMSCPLDAVDELVSNKQYLRGLVLLKMFFFI